MSIRSELSERLLEYYQNIMYATCPEDVFGPIAERDKEDMIEYLVDANDAMMKVLDPVSYPDNLDERDMAIEARDALSSFLASAKAKVLSGTYGHLTKVIDGFFSIKTDGREYILSENIFAQGDVALIYIGRCASGEDKVADVVVKLSAEAVDNVYLENEATCLDIFKNNPGQQNKHLPVLLDRFKTGDGKLGLVLRHNKGYTLEEIRQKPRYRDGIPEKHVAWMMNRGLSAIGFAHLRGVIHCNLAPEHLLITPSNHNMTILDWTGSAYRREQPFRFLRDGFSPPEVAEKQLPIPSSDIYAFGKCMIYALGGDVESGEIPDSVNPGLKDFLRGFILESPLQRADDAWRLHRRLSILRKQWWGPDKFLNFVV